MASADHCKYPRTYASPEAIQRTEVYEFARVTGNSQFILLPFQPYKLIYASMLTEAGKINKALRYCQAVLKTLKTVGHAADGGSTSIVQWFFGNIGLHKMIGPLPPKASDNADINNRPATASSRSSVSLASSASMEPISDNTRRSNMSARSISEPDFRPAQIISPAKGTPNRGVFTSFVQRAMGFIKTPSKEICRKGSVTPSKTSSDSPPLFGVVPKASAKPLAPARFFVPAAAAAAAPDINSNHSVDPSSALAFVPNTAFSNGNGPFAAAAFTQPVVQDMRNDPGPTRDHISSGSSPAMFYSNHYPAAPPTVSLPPPPALEVTPPVMVEQQQQNQHQESSIHQHHHQQSGTVGFEAASSSRVFGDNFARGGIVNHTPQVVVTVAGWILVEQCSEVVVVEGGIFFGWSDSLEPRAKQGSNINKMDQKILFRN
ncbi:hypothetical protein SELMODRAFT_412240 [Selaginella moellendorffii]|uniref:Sec16 Sec23-binding domain-containing protein n=1 Tax=Selaginella moellendorffii TaxID=88036 RepID=D8RKI6_SELML|nr:hypothetical protein SELMODRAFT_412240 [Selaginella moellendorffii]